MKNLALNLIFALVACCTTFSAFANSTIETNCNWESWISSPRKNATYEAGKDVYVKMDCKKYQDIEWVELRLNGKFVRKESKFPFEWGKRGSSGDNYLRKMKSGTYKLECKIKTRCGEYKKIYCTFYVKGGNNGGGGHGGGECQYRAWYQSPQDGKTYPVGSDVYVKVDAKDYRYVKEATLYVNGKKVRTETGYPYEWCKRGSSGDGYLRNLKPGTYKLECKLLDKCGKYKTIRCVFYVKGGGGGHEGGGNNGGGNKKCDFTAKYVYPKSNGYSYKAGSDVYVYVDAKDYRQVQKADLYVNGKYVRTESSWKYEWCKGSGSGDKYLRNLRPGTYKLKCVLYCKYGGKKEIYRTFYVK